MTMRRSYVVRMATVLFFLVTVVFSQNPPSLPPMVQAGSPEDKALRNAENEPDAAKRIQLLDQFLKDFPSMTQLLELNENYTVTYQQLKDTARMVEYGEKALAVKPDDVLVLPLVINGLMDQQTQFDKAYEYAKRYMDASRHLDTVIIGRTVSDEEKNRVQAEAKALYDAARQQKEYHLIQAAYQETDPGKKISAFENFVQEFPDSTQVSSAYSVIAVTYLQQHNIAKSSEAAEECLKVNPNDLDMLVLLADLRVEDRSKMKETAELVRKAVELADALESQPAPQGQTEADWTKRKNYLRGTAHGLRGYIDMKAGLYSKSLPDLELANKLLSDDSATLYRLGFALAKVRRVREAEIYLNRAAKMPGPFQQAARTALSQLQR